MADDQGKQRKTAVIFFVIFLILFIILFFVVIWFFIFRVFVPSFARPCTADKNCLPNEYCNNSVCNAVTCSKNSDCKKTANGYGECVNGYCQTTLCSYGGQCGADEKQACVNYNPAIVSEWINTACVTTGGTCKTDYDCFGGNFGLVCSDSGVCVQCRDNSDCTTGYVCTANLCKPCAQDTDCGAGNICSGSGTCCSGATVYSVNNATSCVKGKTFDICQVDTDCESNKCHDLGNVKVCGFTSSDKCLFTAGTKTNSSVTGTDTKLFNDLTCALPAGVYDTTAAPFCAAGTCQHLSVGAACYVPP